MVREAAPRAPDDHRPESVRARVRRSRSRPNIFSPGGGRGARRGHQRARGPRRWSRNGGPPRHFLDEGLPKIVEANRLVRETGARADIEVDGGVNGSTIDRVVDAGVDIVVAGSAIFDGVDAPAAAKNLRERLDVLAGSSA